MSYITICTPTYNRANTLKRVFESLKKQEFKDFEWLIIDDGSTDNTKEVVDEFIREGFFPIRYYYKENGGRHTALNYSYDFINSKYVINIDSDDELTEDALIRIKSAWDSIPSEDYERFWQVSGRCIDSKTNKMIGPLYPVGINSLKGKQQHKEIIKIKGEKACCRKVSILKKYPFPVYPDTKFVSENTVWEKINQRYDQYCVNDIFRVYHTDSVDSLSSGNMHPLSQRKSQYYISLFYLNECFTQIFYNKLVFRSILNVSKYAMLSGTPIKDTLSAVDKWYKRILVYIGYPVSFLWIKRKKIKS